MLAPKIPIEVLVYVPCGVHLSTGWHAKPSLCLCHNGGAAPNRNAHVNRIITLYGIVTIDIAHLGPRTADSGLWTVHEASGTVVLRLPGLAHLEMMIKARRSCMTLSTRPGPRKQARIELP
jgi:hypothetical protein